MANDILELKPKKGSFYFARLAPVLTICGILLLAFVIAGGVAGLPVLVAVGVGQFVILVGLDLVSTNVAFQKERYELHPHHLVVHRGGLLSTQTTELDLKNVTHVKQHLPWLRYRFFDVGDVIVESAGSSGAEATLRSIRNPDAVYARVRTLLKGNGFALNSERVLHQARPATIGVVIESLGRAVGVIVAIAWLVGTLAVEGDASGDGVSVWVELAFGAIGVLGIASAATATVLHYLDMSRRTYTVTEDAVVYEEGFLSRDNAFIPYENIADADTKKTFVDQVIGLADVTVSCQGSGSEILFRRLDSGAELSQALRGLVSKAAHQKSKAREAAAQVAAVPAVDGGLPDEAGGRPNGAVGFVGVPPQEAWTATLKMSPLRAAVGLLPLLPAFPVWLVGTLVAVVRALSMTYRVGPSALSSKYSLIGEHEMSFAYDKITGVVVQTNPWDSLLGTMTVRVFSIGSSTPLDLAHVSRDDVNLRALLKQAGIPEGPALTTEHADFNPLSWARSALGEFIVLGVFVVGLLIGAVAVHWAMALAIPVFLLWLGAHFVVQLLRSQRQVLSFHPGHVELKEGLLFKTHSYARYDNVKKVQVVRYPGGGDCGRLTLYVAGEIRVQQKGGAGGKANAQAGIPRPTTLTAHYLNGVDAMRTSIDALLSGALSPETVDDAKAAAPARSLMTAKPELGNTLVPMILFGAVIWPLLAFIPWSIWQLKRRTYRVEKDRVVVEQGVFFRAHTSVLFDRIDSLKQGEGALNKLFKNGNITLFTAGSSLPDLRVLNIPNHHAFYRVIRDHYGK